MSRLHPTSLAFDLISHGRTFLFPVLLALFGAAKGNSTLLIISALGIIPAVMASIFRYFTFRYCIHEKHLIVRQGLFFRSARTVPIERIQNIDSVQNLLHRLIKVAEVRVETASGTKPEAVLRVLSLADIDRLRSAVFVRKSEIKIKATTAVDEGPSESFGDLDSGTAPILESAEATGPRPFQDTPRSILRIPVSWLIKAGLASDRGLLMIGIVLGFYFQFGSDDPQDLIRWVSGFLPASTSSLSTVLGAGLAICAALLIIRILGVGWFILRFYGYDLTRQGDDLRIRCGLFTKVTATIPRRRIQFVSVHEKLIMRWLGLVSLKIETAGGASGPESDATATISKRWFVPVIPRNQVQDFINEIRPGLKWESHNWTFHPLHPKAGKRLCRLSVVQATMIGMLGLFFSVKLGWIAGAIAAPLLWIWALRKGRSMKYARNENGVVYKSGVLNRKTSFTFFEKIQTISIHQNPFDQRWGMARLVVDTAAAGPAEHWISIPYLDASFAREELQNLRVKTGLQQPVFG
ncbi:MAG: PH domain-containing protein [Planctomycetota bacterium]